MRLFRPDDGRVNDQVRRNHSTQYFSYPDHKFADFRKTDPEKYESYADMGMNEWIKMKIIIKGDHAQLFINDSKQPCLIVNDLNMMRICLVQLVYGLATGQKDIFPTIEFQIDRCIFYSNALKSISGYQQFFFPRFSHCRSLNKQLN